MRNFINLVEENSSPVEYRISAGTDTQRLVNDTDPDLWENKRIRYLVSSEAEKENHIIATKADKIVGMAGVQTNPRYTAQLWIKFISVDPEYQGQGIARELLRRVYLYARENDQRLKPGSLTDDGEGLRHIHDEFDKTFPGVAFDRINGHYVDDDGKRL